MKYQIKRIELYVRETPPGRMAFALGKQGGAGDVKKGLLNPLGHVRMIVADDQGNETFGCSGDRLSVRWLDKRPGRSLDRKRRELVSLIEQARKVWLDNAEFESPFRQWRTCHQRIMELGSKAGQVALTSSFASALFERAMVDAVSRLNELPVFLMVKDNRLGFDPKAVHPETAGLDYPKLLPRLPRTRFAIRHTVGLLDPLTKDEVPDEKRVNDGLPQTLDEYIAIDGVRHFKVKISGDPDRDLKRLERVWEVVSRAIEPVITLDANEAYDDLKTFETFVKRFESEQIGAFQHVEYIEQPLPRALTFDPGTAAAIQRISESKRLLIDEADGTVDSYRKALELGYLGTSHKNCKGFFKSLLNHTLAVKRSLDGQDTFLSGEDLQNLPVVPLQQDFATLGILGIDHCERNGHHYNFGLAHLSEKDRERAVKRHPDLYVERKGQAFLSIIDGSVECASIHNTGFGVQDEPDWQSMMKMSDWVKMRHPAHLK